MRTLYCLIAALWYTVTAPFRVFREGFIRSAAYYEFKDIAVQLTKESF